MTPRPSSRNWRDSSNSVSNPGAMKPPSRVRSGGSATRAASSRDSRSSWPVRAPVAWAISGGRSAVDSWAVIASAWVSPLRIAARSRGPARSMARRDRARSRSGTRRRASRRDFAVGRSATMASTAARRSLIVVMSRDGLERRRSSRRAPPGVTVRSMAAKSDPARPPDSAWVSSRLRRVAASICTVRSEASRSGLRSSGSLPFCVMSR